MVSLIFNKTFNPLKAVDNPKKDFSKIKNTIKNSKIINE